MALDRLSSGISPTACVDNLRWPAGTQRNRPSRPNDHNCIYTFWLVHGPDLPDEVVWVGARAHRSEHNARSVFTRIASLTLICSHVEDDSIDLICNTVLISALLPCCT